jgi:hypothetical protein
MYFKLAMSSFGFTTQVSYVNETTDNVNSEILNSPEMF